MLFPRSKLFVIADVIDGAIKGKNRLDNINLYSSRTFKIQLILDALVSKALSRRARQK